MRELRLRRPAEPEQRRLPAARPEWRNLFVAQVYSNDAAEEPPTEWHEPAPVPRRRRGGRRGSTRREGL